MTSGYINILSVWSLLVILIIEYSNGYPSKLNQDIAQVQSSNANNNTNINSVNSIQNLVVESDLKHNNRKSKSLQFFLDPSNAAFGSGSDQEPFLLDFDEQLEAALAAQLSEGQQDNEILSRARPSSARPLNKLHSNGGAYPNSPIYYIRLPPAPYMYVPGLGYVSQPPTLRPPPVQAPTDSPFINLPLSFVSNAKPTGVYTWMPPQVTERPQIINRYQPRPQPPQKTQPMKDTSITTLDKGPYVFNGRPADIFLLRNTYNSLYADALQNFYP